VANAQTSTAPRAFSAFRFARAEARADGQPGRRRRDAILFAVLDAWFSRRQPLDFSPTVANFKAHLSVVERTVTITSATVGKDAQMRCTDPPKAAAWAPWLDGDRDWLMRRDAVAAQWLIKAARKEGSSLVVQGTSHANDYRDNRGPLGQLARKGKVATYRSPVGHGATYAHHADIRLLANAMTTADGRSLVATEIPNVPLHGWAMAVSAINLHTGEPTVDTRTAEQVELVEAFVDQLYNGWSHKQVGRRASAYYLPKLAESGMIYAEFVGSVVALDPAHLDSNSDIEAMRKALPPRWEAERRALSRL